MCRVPPRAFRPPPEVTSAVVRIDVYGEPAIPEVGEGFFRLVRAGFSAPRKQIRNSLSSGLKASPGAVEAMLLAASIEPGSPRPDRDHRGVGPPVPRVA